MVRGHKNKKDIRQLDHSGAMSEVKTSFEEKHLNWKSGRRDRNRLQCM